MLSIKSKIDISFLTNPFYIYCIAFLSAILIYLWGWSDIYPKLSSSLIIFLILSFIPFVFTGYVFEKIKFSVKLTNPVSKSLIDIVFYFIILLGTLDVLLAGYIPIIDRTHNYREFGAPVIDVLFNTLSIFFSTIFLHLFLLQKRKKYLLYLFIILIIQIILYRRSALVWIIASSLYFLLLYLKRVHIGSIGLAILLLPVLAYAFGYMGIKRSKLTHTQIIDDLGASKRFNSSGLSQNYYLTYLYLSSPLANLQENISTKDKFVNKTDFKDFFYYCLMPQSLTSRLEKQLELEPPNCKLITFQLIVGTCYMMSYCTLGWFGILLMLLFILFSILLSLYLARRWNTFFFTSVAVLSTAVSIMIFDNILNRLDVLLMLFCYPVLFHFINSYFLGKNAKSVVEL